MWVVQLCSYSFLLEYGGPDTVSAAGGQRHGSLALLLLLEDVNLESGKLKEEDLFHVPICLGCLKADIVSGGRMWVMMEEYGRTVTFIFLSCDSRLGDPYTHGKGAGTGGVRGVRSSRHKFTMGEAARLGSLHMGKAAFKGEDARLKVKKGKKAWAEWKLKDAVGTKQHKRGVEALEGDGRKGDERTGGGLNSIQEKIDNSAREAVATTSMIRREIVTKVASEVRHLEKGTRTRSRLPNKDSDGKRQTSNKTVRDAGGHVRQGECQKEDPEKQINFVHMVHTQKMGRRVSITVPRCTMRHKKGGSRKAEKMTTERTKKKGGGSHSRSGSQSQRQHAATGQEDIIVTEMLQEVPVETIYVIIKKMVPK